MNRFICRQVYLIPYQNTSFRYKENRIQEYVRIFSWFWLYICLMDFSNYVTPVIINGIRGILKRDLYYIEVWVPTSFQLTGFPISCKSVSCRELGFKFYCPLLVKIKYVYTGGNRRNVRDFGRVFLRSNYTDITQNTYIQSSMVTEILAIEVWNFDSYYSLIDYQIHI